MEESSRSTRSSLDKMQTTCNRNHFGRFIVTNMQGLDGMEKLIWPNPREHTCLALGDTSEQVQDKQTHFMKFVVEQDLLLANPWFSKSMMKTVTRPQARLVCEQWDTHTGVGGQAESVLIILGWKTAAIMHKHMLMIHLAQITPVSVPTQIRFKQTLNTKSAKCF